MATLAEQLSRFLDANHFTQEITAESVAADAQFGLVVKGPWETYADGFAEHTRRNARALALTGAPVALRSVHPRIRIAMGEELQIDEQYKDVLRRTIASVTAEVLQVVPTDGSLKVLIGHQYLPVEQLRQINARRVFYSVWERSSGLQDDDRKALQSVGQVWVACQANAEFLEREGIDPSKIRVFPCPYLPGDPMLAVAAKKRLSAAQPMFFHVGKWEPRKEQRNMLGAFLLAFRPGEARFLLKTSERSPFFEGYPPNVQVCIEDWLKDDRVRANGWTAQNVGESLRAETRRLTTEQLAALYQAVDCYVTLSRGEGFDMPAFDGKLAGCMMLYTPSGGPQDFASEGDVRVEPKGRIACHPSYRWAPGSEYLDYDLEAATEGFREAARRLKAGVSVSRDLSSFSAESVGERMLSALRDLGDLGF